jgi:two-component system sensor histidine kinase ChiS
MMPGLSGYETLKRLRERYSVQELPVVLLTARDQISDLVMGFQCGTNDYLTKPIIKEELLVRVKFHMHVAREHRRVLRDYGQLRQRLDSP